MEEAGTKPREPWNRGDLRLFLSHTSEHRELAGKIRDRLHQLGVDSFVAHGTIEATLEWQEVIETALRTCHAMAALITPDFKASQYCHQEIGFAMARRLLIVGVRQGADPPGFLSKHQGLAGDVSEAAGELIADRIYDTLAAHKKTETKIARVAVQRYARSPSRAAAFANLGCVMAIRKESWNDEMVEILERAGQTNPYLGNQGYGFVDIVKLAGDHLDELLGRPQQAPDS